jgi:FSR family fosmidomycin resistance protein-like MFS transporter
MFGGNGGFAVSPFLAGFVLEAYGPKGIAPFVLMNLFLVPLIMRRLNPDLQSATAKDTEAKLAEIKEDKLSASLSPISSPSLRWYQTTATLIVIFAIIVLLRNTLQQSLNSFLPIYYKDQGYGLEFAGAATTAYLFAAAFGSYIGATLSDRFSRLFIMSVSMFLITPLNLLLLQTSSTILIFIISIALGLIFNANWPILLMVGQEIFPGKAGSASGLVFGWAFMANAVGGYFTGELADNIGLTEALRMVALLPILAAFLILALPSEERGATPILQPAPQAGD